MRIQYAILSVTADPKYVGFVPSVAAQWRKLIPDVKVTALCVGAQFAYLEGFKDWTPVAVPLRPNIPASVQALWARYYYLAQLGPEIGILSDVDMYPLHWDYFCGQLEDVPDDAHVHLYPNHPNYTRLPSCYHVAQGNVFARNLGIADKPWRVSMQEVWDARRQTNGWFSDEDFATRRLRESKCKLYLPPRRVESSRINRKEPYNLAALQQGCFYDFHAPRPYFPNCEYVHRVLNASQAVESSKIRMLPGFDERNYKPCP
jgi:hypothetical protein